MAPGTRKANKRRSTDSTSRARKRPREDAPEDQPGLQKVTASNLLLDEDALAERIAARAMAKIDAKLQQKPDPVPGPSTSHVADIFELEEANLPDGDSVGFDNLLSDQGSRSTQGGAWLTTEPLSNACARLPPSLEVISNKLLQAAFSPSSRKMYERFFASYVLFCATIWPQLNPVPASINMVRAYIRHLFGKGLAHTTILSHLSAISYVHKIRRLENPTESFLIKKLLIGVRKNRPSVDNRYPISPYMLH